MKHALLALLASCGGGLPPTLAPSVTHEVTFVGMCDASAAVALSPTRMLVADDEDNALRIYEVTGGTPLATIDLSAQLALDRVGKRRPHYPETDIEAATVIGDRALWLTSHGRNSKAKAKPERLRLFATTRDESAQVVGVYTELLADLLADPRLVALGLAEAAARAPKAEGGFNLEGMTATPDGELLIGVRNPVPAGKALVLRITNPLAVFAGDAPVLGAPIELDLGGRGVRELAWWRGRYLIAAGSPTGAVAPGPALYTWDGSGAPTQLAADVGVLTPEALFVHPALDRVLVLSDDGAVSRGGMACKDRPHAREKSFRAVWVEP